MSLETIIWAFHQQIRPASAKFVLVALGDNANDETGKAYPSIAAICYKTSLERKTVMKALASLEKAKVITDTGQRVGTTKQVKVYQLDEYLVDSGRVPKTDPLSNSAVFDTEQSRFSTGTVPKTGHGTATEPQGNLKTKGATGKKAIHAELISKWFAAYREFFKAKYAFQHAKDGRAVKQLLATTELTPDELMAIARAAWANSGGFFSKGAVSIAGFNSKFNEIRQELNLTNGKTNQRPLTESRRNVGTANEGRSSQYAGVGRVRRVSDAGQ